MDSHSATWCRGKEALESMAGVLRFIKIIVFGHKIWRVLAFGRIIDILIVKRLT